MPTKRVENHEHFEEENHGVLHYLKYGLHAAILLGLIIAGFRYLRGEEVLDALLDFQYAYLPLLLLLSLGHFYAKARRFVLLMDPLSDVRSRHVLRAYFSSHPATMVPGGIAGRVALMYQLGTPPGDSSAGVLMSGVLDQVTYILGALVAAAVFEEARTPALIGLTAVIALIALGAYPRTRSGLLAVGHWIADKVGGEHHWEHFESAASELFESSLLLKSFALTVLGTLLDVAILYICILGLGITLPVERVFLAYILSMTLGILSPLPAGIGPVEAGLVGVLATSGKLAPETATVVVAIFRVATIVFRAAAGALIYLLLWKGEDELTNGD
jgi:uncharacterized protein (TIRG00374 family)